MKFTPGLLKRRLSLGAAVFAAVALGPWAPCGWASEHGGEEPPAESEDAGAESATGFRGIELGEFKIRTSHTVASRRDSVSFVLHAAVKSEDYKNFERQIERRISKMRDLVVVATRLVPIEDYDDPELKKFRRRILLRLHRSLPELPIADVYISDFTLSAETL